MSLAVHGAEKLLRRLAVRCAPLADFCIAVLGAAARPFRRVQLRQEAQQLHGDDLQRQLPLGQEYQGTEEHIVEILITSVTSVVSAELSVALS